MKKKYVPPTMECYEMETDGRIAASSQFLQKLDKDDYNDDDDDGGGTGGIWSWYD